MFILRGAVFWLTLLLTIEAQAQIVNVLSLLSSEADNGIGGRLGLALQWKTGNTEIMEAKATGAVVYKHDANTLYLIANGRFGSKTSLRKVSLRGKQVYASHVFEHLRYRRMVLDWVGIEIYAQHEADRFRRLSTRAVGGFGGRFSVSPLKGLDVILGTGYLFEYEIFSEQDDLSGSQHAGHRWSSYVQVDYRVQERVSLHHTLFAQPRFDRITDIRVLSQSALKLSATKWLGIRIALTIAFDSQPPAGVEQHDTAIETTLEIDF